MTGDFPDIPKEDVMGLGLDAGAAGGRARKTTTLHPPLKVRRQLIRACKRGLYQVSTLMFLHLADKHPNFCSKSDSLGKFEQQTV